MMFHSAYYIIRPSRSIFVPNLNSGGQIMPLALYALTAGAFGIGVADSV